MYELAILSDNLKAVNTCIGKIIKSQKVLETPCFRYTIISLKLHATLHP